MPIFKFTNNSNSYGGAPHEVEEHKTMLKIDALEAGEAIFYNMSQVTLDHIFPTVQHNKFSC